MLHHIAIQVEKIKAKYAIASLNLLMSYKELISLILLILHKNTFFARTAKSLPILQQAGFRDNLKQKIIFFV